MIQKKVILGVLIGFAFGLGTATFQRGLDSAGPDLGITSQLKSKVQEYLELKKMKDQYEKADQLLGEVLTLLLTHLGLKLNPNEREILLSTTRKVETTEPEPKEIFDKRDDIQSVPEGVGAKLKEVNPPIKNWQGFEVELPDVHDPEAAQRFLDKVRIDDFSKAVDSSQNLSRWKGYYENINGAFEGDVVLRDRTWKMRLVVNGQMDQGTFRGQSRLVLTDENGKDFSSGSSEGTLDDNFRAFLGNSRGFLVMDSNGGHYFQMYLLSGNERMIGNYYEKRGVQPYRLRGKVLLDRQAFAER